MTHEAKFVLNCWYMGAWTSEVGQNLLRRRLLDMPILFYRREDGEPVAMIDRCSHRFAPLSSGEREGDCVRCPYHGLLFDSRGNCVENPYSDEIPKGTAIRTFPVAEKDGILWFWPGNPSEADETELPDFSSLFIEGHGAPLSGYTFMPAPYELGTDNLMDLSHIEWVHKGTFAGNGVIFAGKHKVAAEGNSRLHSNWWMPDVSAPPHTAGIYPPDLRCDHWLDMRWDAPASMYLQVGACAVGADREEGVITHQAHILTPETATTTHYFWASTRTLPPSEEIDGMLTSLFSQAFEEEDKPIIAACFENMDGVDFWKLQPAFLGIDAGGTMARRALEKLRKKEKAA